jgi:hypothetical protein
LGFISDLGPIVPWQSLGKWALRIVEDRHFKGKELLFHLKNGSLVSGRFERYSVDHKTFFVARENGSSLGVPFENVLYLNVQNVPTAGPSPKDYPFGGMKWTLRDFPEPFVQKDGLLDMMFVHGEGSRDYADYREFLRKKGEPASVPTKVGRRGDFEYVTTLSAALGFAACKANPRTELPIISFAKQGLQLAEADLACNLVTVGSGAINTFSRRIFEVYGNELPIHFGAPDSDDQIIDQSGPETKTYSRRIDNEWNTGFIELLPNPFCPSKAVLVVAGLTVAGTQAGLRALCEATFRKILNDRLRTFGDGTMTVPAQVVRATNIRYDNGLESVGGYEFVE